MTIGQLEVKDRMDRGKVGSVAQIGDHLIEENFPNSDPQQIQKDTITVDSASDDTVYQYTAESETVKITSGSGATTSSIAQKLADEHNSNPVIRGTVEATANGADVELQSTAIGVTYSVSESDSNLSLTSVQSADEADPVGMGLAVLDDGTVADASALTAKSITLVHPGSSADLLLEADGKVYDLSAASGSAMASAINSEGGLSDVVTASNPSGEKVKIEAATAGDDFEIVSADEFTVDAQTVGDLIEDRLGGITRDTFAEESADQYQYPGNAGVIALQRGKIFVEGGDSASQGDPVYLEMAGSSKGKFFTSRAADRVKVDRKTMKWADANKIKINLF